MATQKYDPIRTSRQIENRNFLSPNGFRFALRRSPQVAFFCNQANIPDMTLGVTEQATYLKNIPVPGDKIEFGDLNLRFLVDEDLGNYMEIQKWIRGLGFPESLDEFEKLESQAEIFGRYAQDQDNIYSDGTLSILSSNLIPKFQIFFRDLFPYSLSTMTFDATQTDQEYFTADVSFKYTIYTVTDINNNPI
jgi:hypothetical protein|tara:strand:- start:690 stop:1265 length:576 start_codon:yes stop_codon:yes gene_type:complete